MQVTKNRRITCIADESVDYTFPDGAIEHIMEKECMSQDEAIDYAIGKGLGVRENYSVEVDEVVMEHDVSYDV